MQLASDSNLFRHESFLQKNNTTIFPIVHITEAISKLLVLKLSPL